MASSTATGALPPVPLRTSTQVAAEGRSSAIDFVNRVNYLFEEFDTKKMLSCFQPDAIAYHFHGTINGHVEIKKFFEVDYPYLIPGVSRHASNHIVDRDEETGGVVVRYHNHLVRFAWPDKAEEVTGNKSTQTGSEDGLPGIWIWSPMIDRLKWTDDGWKIQYRTIGGSVVNKKLDYDAKPKN